MMDFSELKQVAMDYGMESANKFRSACALDSTVVDRFSKRVGSAVLLKSENAYVMNACM